MNSMSARPAETRHFEILSAVCTRNNAMLQENTLRRCDYSGSLTIRFGRGGGRSANRDSENISSLPLHCNLKFSFRATWPRFRERFACSENLSGSDIGDLPCRQNHS